MIGGTQKIFAIASLILFAIGLTGCAGLGDFDIEITPQLIFISINPSDRVIVDEIGSYVIEGTIKKINWDDSYVIAKQNVIDDDFEESSEINYWIIDIKEKNTYDVYGPLSKKEYLEKKKEFGIDLKLEDADTIKNERWDRVS